MPRAAVAFSSAEQRSRPLDAARLLNLYPEQPPLGARAPSLVIGQNVPLKAVLYGCPGLALWQTAGTGPIRAMRYALGYFWALSGQLLYRIAQDGTLVLCTGDVIEPSGSAMMTDNGRQLAVLVNGKTYIVGTTYAKASFDIASGSFLAGTNRIVSVAVNSVTITSAAVNWSGSHIATAEALAANINAFQAVYRATVAGTTVQLDAVAGGASPNGFVVAVVVGGDVTVHPTSTTMTGGQTTDTTVALMAATAYPVEGATSIATIDGYTIWTRGGTSRQFFISALNDSASLNALDFASAESNPSALIRVLVDHREIWFFKEDGIEVWVNTGASPFPFERIPGAVLEKGCGAALSPAKADNSVFWLGNDGSIYRAAGYQPQRISSHAIEDAIRGRTVSDAYGMSYIQGGHVFYVITFPTVGRTWVYDATTTAWHDRMSGTILAPAPWKVRCVAAAWNKVYAGIDAGRICVLDLDTYSDAGDTIRRAAVTAPIFVDGKRAILHEVELECELGVGLANGQGSDPQVMLRISTDGGNSWGNERRMSLGAMGNGRRRAIARRLGIFRQMMLEFSVSDPVKCSFYGMRFTAKALAS